jgi:hypothetical protein
MCGSIRDNSIATFNGKALAMNSRSAVLTRDAVKTQTICIVISCLLLLWCAPGLGQDASENSVERERLDVMRKHAAQIVFRASAADFPKTLLNSPLFRYDDPARGYVDGTVWRLGEHGRPKAIVTAELHPKYSNEPRIVCDYLSLSDTPFVAMVSEGVTWTPAESAVKMKVLPDSPKLADTKSQRLFQLKKMSERFHGRQSVEGETLDLRLLPRPIDRYQPGGDDSDAALFVFVSGRNPGVLLVIEAMGDEWKYGVGRLSGPSSLTLTLDGNQVWHVKPAVYQWGAPYTAANYPVKIPGI